MSGYGGGPGDGVGDALGKIGSVVTVYTLPPALAAGQLAFVTVDPRRPRHHPLSEGRFEQQVYGYFTVNETFDVGCDTVLPVSDLYQSPFVFTGEIIKVMVDVSEATFEELAAQHEARARYFQNEQRRRP
jgi:hypothetical protein